MNFSFAEEEVKEMELGFIAEELYRNHWGQSLESLPLLFSKLGIEKVSTPRLWQT